ncbi:hypothetical protein [Methanocella arvoryzae]|uniref:Uncharacterized protein n=1 Tax=Methanocella arvoryzae (strain DSM 22066 / NBRC 105507 / MRE50) TaxID=351160 RepID=Q0W3H0_METAR|nr:hypothetical protein [Methanocella arvoryzae]CAJ37073.1 hypothetical protein RCIX1900 [Methanocella arvoryzae MRE50]
MFGFLKKLFGGGKKIAFKKCFFEKNQICDQTCRAFSEKGTCSIVDRVRETRDPKECAEALRALRNIHKDPDRIARDYPDLFPPPKLYYENDG